MRVTRSTLSFALLLAASAHGAPTPGRPAEGRFSLVLDEPCDRSSGEYPGIEDFGDRTLVISRRSARFFTPGRPAGEALDVGAGLPSPRGNAWIFSARPPIVTVQDWSPGRPEQHARKSQFRLEGARWTEMTASFGDVSAVARVETGAVVIGWVRDREHGDAGGVPAGDLTRAWRVGLDGAVSLWEPWPYVMSWQERSTPRVVWAVAANPNRPGLFLLRLPIDGRARLTPIPGLGGCRGDHRLGGLTRLADATDDEARLSVDDSGGCVRRTAVGSYRFSAAGERWLRTGPPPPFDLTGDWHDLVAGDETFMVREGEVLVRGPAGEVRRYPVPDLHLGKATTSDAYLKVTAGGLEVWAVTEREGRCRVYRY